RPEATFSGNMPRQATPPICPGVQVLFQGSIIPRLTACASPAASRAQRGEAVRWMRVLGGHLYLQRA
ncbi:MAG: hypothetical protein ACP5Q1_08690, partial [Anaerolineae bacterium]